MLESGPQDRIVKVRDINLRYVDWGDNGPLLLLMHGSMRTSRSWDAMARDLQHRFHVISMDARGHGDSDWTPDGYSYTNRAKDLKAFCDELGLTDIIGVGHSAGAVTLTLYAEQYPEAVKGLVLLEPRVIAEENVHRGDRQQPVRPRRTWNSREELHEFLKQHRTAGRWRDDVILDVVNHETMELPDGRIDMKWSADSMNGVGGEGDYSDLKPIFRTLGLPMLFVVSEIRAPNFRDMEPIASEVPNFHLTVVKNTDHNMYMERPDAVASLISNFADNGTIPKLV